MKKIILITIVTLLFISCVNTPDNKYPCVFNFWYEKNDAVGPEGLVSLILITDRDDRNMLLAPKPPTHLLFKYNGGIYDIDSLHFMSPAYDIRIINDSAIVFGQAVHGLRQYSESFMDSIIAKTKKEIVIEIIDTLDGKKWIISNCYCCNE